MKIQFIIHEAYEGPGAYFKWALARGHEAVFCRLYQGDLLPRDSQGLDLLIVMGGPQSPETTLAECPHFDAGAEMRLIRAYVQAGKPVIGVCLGAQLLGQALGAPVEHSPEREIGNFPIQLTPAGRADARLADFADQEVVGHWHGDMPGLTPDAEVLATSQGCPRQIVRYGQDLYGFQCHLEFDRKAVEGLLVEEVDYPQRAQEHRYLAPAEDILTYNYAPMNALLWSFLDKLV